MKAKNIRISIQCFLLVVLAIFAILSLIKFASMSGQVADLQFQLVQLEKQIKEQDASIEAIHHDVDEQLRRQASLFSSVSYSYDAFHTETGTADMLLTVIPKTITDDIQMKAILGDYTVTFEKGENDSFHATIPTEIFSVDEHPLVIMEAGGERKTELLDHVDTDLLFTDYLPTLSADVKGVANYNHSSSKLKMDASLTVEYKTSNLFDAYFMDMSIVVKTNDKEIFREDITNNVKGSSQTKITNGTYTAPFTDTYTVILGEDFYVYLVATDSLGYEHEYLAYHWLRSTENVTPEFIYGGEIIYDADGNMMYGKN